MISKNLKILLETHDEKISIRELARRIDVPFSTLQRVLSGDVSRTNKKAIKAIANYFSISIEELVNSELPNKIPNSIKENFSIHSIPILNWDEVLNWNKHISNPTKQSIIVEQPQNKAFFALKIEKEVEPLFPKNSLVIFEPDKKPQDRNYVLTHLKKNNAVIFSKIIIDHQKIFLLDKKDHSSTKLLELDLNKDKIIAVMIEARISFN